MHIQQCISFCVNNAREERKKKKVCIFLTKMRCYGEDDNLGVGGEM